MPLLEINKQIVGFIKSDGGILLGYVEK